MVQQQYHNKTNNSAKLPEREHSPTNEASGPNLIPARTKVEGVKVPTCSDLAGAGTRPDLTNSEVVTSFQSTQPGSLSLSSQAGSTGIKKKPPAPLPKPDIRKPRNANFMDNSGTGKSGPFSELKNMKTEQLNQVVGTNQSSQYTPDMKNDVLSLDGNFPVLQKEISSEVKKVHFGNSTTTGSDEVITKFPNSFVATKKSKNILKPSKGYHVSQSSVLSNSSESSNDSSKAPVIYGVEEAVTSFQTLENVEPLSGSPFNRSMGEAFSRSSMCSMSSSSSSYSSKSSGSSSGSFLLPKTYSGSSNGRSSVLMSPSSSSLSSSSSQVVSSLDVSSASLVMPEGRCVVGSIPEVPEYDQVNASSCDKCSEGKCRTVYLQIPELPFGWEKVEDPHYGVYYIDHVNRKTQYEYPTQASKNQTGEEVINTFPRHKKAAEAGTKRSASENNMQGQLYSPAGRQFFTKDPGELKGEFTQTSLVKSARGLGFTIIGSNHKDTQFLQIKNVVENGPAYLSGKFRTGDVIVRVNNTCVLGFTHQDVVRLFQSIAPGETVQLEICRGYPLNFDPNDPNTELVTTMAVNLHQDGCTYNGQPIATSNGTMESVNPHILRAGMKSLPDLTRSVVGQGHNSISSISPSNSQEEAGTNGMMNYDDTIPDLVSLSINNRPEMLTVPIMKGPMGFGFTIADSPYGQRVKQILDQSRCKNLAEGDLLVMINSINVRELPHQQAVQVLKDCKQDQETVIVVQRRGIPPVVKGKKLVKLSRSFDQQQLDNSFVSPGAYFFQNQDPNFQDHLHDNYINNGVRAEMENGVISPSILPPPIEEADEDAEDFEGEKFGNRTSPQDSQRPKTPLDGNRAMAPGTKVGSPRQHGYMDMQLGRRDYQDVNDFSKLNSNHSRAGVEGSSMGRPPRGPSRPDFFPRFDPRLGNGDARGDPFQRPFLSNQNHVGTGDERWSYTRDVKPGQFRSRTPGPELMARGGSGPDSGRPDIHRPKTPTAADMRSNGKHMTSFGTGDFKSSGRYTPNPSSEQGRQYRSPYHDHPRNWPEFSTPPPHPGYEPFENSSLNRSYGGEFPRSQFQNSIGLGRPVRQSTSFESDKPAPSSISRIPRKPPPHPVFQGLSPRSQKRIITDENGSQVMEMLVTLHRQESGYGFRIIGGTEESSQVSVGHIVPGGAADLDGRLQQDDEITHVDGCSVLNASHHRVVELMTNAALNGRVTLSIKRVLSPGDSKTPDSITPQYPFDVVVSRRENEGFGFVIISSVNKSGASVDEFIGHIQENSPAARCGRLHVGERILAVNGIDTSNMHHKDVVGLIKDSGFSVALTIGPPPDDNSGLPQKSMQGPNITNYSGDKPDMNIQSWERNQPGMARDINRPRVLSNKNSDENGEIYQLELNRGSRGFGFSIRGGREFNAMPLYVLRIADGGAADLDGRLKVGDQILEINGCNTENMTHAEAIDTIQTDGLSVKLLMRRTNKPPPVFEGPPATSSGLMSGGPFIPNIPPVANGPIGHSSPHMARRQLPQLHQPLPPPPPELQQPNNDYFNYPPPPSAVQISLQQQHNNY